MLNGIFKVLFVLIGAIGMVVISAIFYGVIVMALWNWLMPAIFGLTAISYLQGFGLCVLGNLLTGGFNSKQEKE